MGPVRRGRWRLLFSGAARRESATEDHVDNPIRCATCAALRRVADERRLDKEAAGTDLRPRRDRPDNIALLDFVSLVRVAAQLFN